MKTNNQLVYTKYGHGNRILFAFHGFGQDKTFFASWETILGDTFTILAFDLFHHGESFRPNKPLSKQELANLLEPIIEKENIDNFSILGYSLGGRFAISTCMSFPKKTEELILIAPDGIFLTIWFKLATTPIIRRVFKYIMDNPNKLDQLISFNKKIKMINGYIADFIRKEMGTSENKKRVYISWNNFKSLGYSHKQLIEEFNRHDFRRSIYLGTRDYVIKPYKIRPIIEKMGKFDVFELDKKHHQMLNLEVAQMINERSKLM